MKKILLVLSVFLIAGVGCSSGEVIEEKEQSNAYAPIFDLSFTDYEGVEHTLSDEIGTPLVVNSWAAWCPFCKKELVEFAQAQKDFQGHVQFIAIDRAESLRVAKGYTDNLGVSDSMKFWLDPDDSFYKGIGGFAMPETIFVNSDGDVVFHKRGPMDLEDVSEKIEELLL